MLDYLGRYMHRVAISNHRLLSLEQGNVTFSWKDYRHGHQQRRLTLSAAEFIRRFLLHTLPRGFQRMRHFGLLSNRARVTKLARCRQLLGVAPDPANNSSLARPPTYQALYQALTGASLTSCPACHHGQLRRIELIAPLSQLLPRLTAAPTPFPLDSS